MLPVNPSSQNNKQIEAFPCCSTNTFICSFPPYLKGCILWLRGESFKLNLPQEGEPKLPSEDARYQEVINGLILLVTQGH
jgi:hypothetical protein